MPTWLAMVARMKNSPNGAADCSRGSSIARRQPSGAIPPVYSHSQLSLPPRFRGGRVGEGGGRCFRVQYESTTARDLLHDHSHRCQSCTPHPIPLPRLTPGADFNASRGGEGGALLS